MWLVQNFRAVDIKNYETLKAKEEFQKVMPAQWRGEKVYFG